MSNNELEIEQSEKTEGGYQPVRGEANGENHQDSEAAAEKVKARLELIDNDLATNLKSFKFERFGVNEEAFREYLSKKNYNEIALFYKRDGDGAFNSLIADFQENNQLKHRKERRQAIEDIPISLEEDNSSSEDRRLRGIGRRIREANIATDNLLVRLEDARSNAKSEYTEEEVLREIAKNDIKIGKLLKIRESLERNSGKPKAG